MATETVLNKLTINSVESREVYKKMQEKGLINEDEIYLVSSDDAGEDIPSTTSLIKGDGSGGLVAATPETDYASPAIARKVTLTVAGWNSSTKQQTVACAGVLADITKQELRPNPVDTSYESAWNTCGIQAVAQGADSVTFQCSDIPTTAVEIFVVICAVNYQS